MKKLPNTLAKAKEELATLRESLSITYARIKEVEKIKTELENKVVLKQLRVKYPKFEDMTQFLKTLDPIKGETEKMEENTNEQNI